MTVDFEIDPVEQAKAPRRLNVGCGQWPLLYWTNLDESDDAYADIYQHVPPLPFADGSLDDIYAGHCLEHLSPADARAFLRECYRALAPGGRLGILVPDTREILRRYLAGDRESGVDLAGTRWNVADLNHVCHVFLYSTVQASRHLWSYDETTLHNAMTAAGFVVTGAIDRWHDPRIPVGAWYQMGLDAVKP
jgi:predicted SAM-dependent methyltransferase